MANKVQPGAHQNTQRLQDHQAARAVGDHPACAQPEQVVMSQGVEPHHGLQLQPRAARDHKLVLGKRRLVQQ